VKTGVALSGGMDSRLLLAIIHKNELCLPSFTYGRPGSHDLKEAARLARLVAGSHTGLNLRKDYPAAFAEEIIELCEGRVDCFGSHGLLLNQMNAVCDVILLANGGEYLFGLGRDSYSSALKAAPESHYEKYFRFRNRYILEKRWADLFQPGIYKRAKDYPRQKLFSILDSYHLDDMDDVIDTHRFNEVQMNRSLQGLYMINHVMEFTQPYFDRDLVRTAIRLPLRMRKKRYVHNTLLSRYDPEMARIKGGPLWKRSKWEAFQARAAKRLQKILVDTRLLKETQLQRPSSTFSNLHRLSRLTVNRNWIEGLLFSKNARVSEYLNPSAVRDLVGEHMRANENLTEQIGILVTFEMFLRRYIV
jgi:asparagine synthetase B (glutamine-hydrolysing)